MDVLRDKVGSDPVGFLMPRVAGFKPIHALYLPKSRTSEFPSASWPFLIHSAANLARAFTVVHNHGLVVGDVNHGNVMVSDQAMVIFIDCDSFQIAEGQHAYLCEVGVPTHTPPELQARSFRGVLRTPNHDAFGLAVLIFQLLCMGRHPFSGSYLGAGEMPLERAIKEFRFAYGSGATLRQMKQPPGTLLLPSLTEPVTALFERAFSASGTNGKSRPSGQEWTSALEQLSKGIRQCTISQSHHYPAALSSCPWCAIEAGSGVLLFGVMVAASPHAHSRFDLTSVWAQIASVPWPGDPPALPSLSSLKVSPSPRAAELGRKRRRRSVAAACLFAVMAVVVVLVAAKVSIAVIAVALVVAPWFWRSLVGSVSDDLRNDVEEKRRTAERDLRIADSNWQEQATLKPFIGKLRELEDKKSQYQQLPALRQDRLSRLKEDARNRQLYRFLDRYQIVSASISSIGPSRTTMLQSYGIETAADISFSAVTAVPGFGPTLAQRLLDWRGTVEQRFRFDPKRALDPSDVSALERDLDSRRVKLEQELTGGVEALRQISRQIANARGTLRRQHEQAMLVAAQAEADLRAL